MENNNSSSRINSPLSNFGELTEIERVWVRQKQFKLAEIEKEQLRQRLEDWKLAHTSMNPSSIMKNLQSQKKGNIKKTTKFQKMQLSINKAKVELVNFQKYQQNQERNQKREDLIMQETQKLIVKKHTDVKSVTNLMNAQKTSLANTNPFFAYKKKQQNINHIIEMGGKRKQLQKITSQSIRHQRQKKEEGSVSPDAHEHSKQRDLNNAILTQNSQFDSNDSKQEMSGFGLVAYKTLYPPEKVNETNPSSFWTLQNSNNLSNNNNSKFKDSSIIKSILKKKSSLPKLKINKSIRFEKIDSFQINLQGQSELSDKNQQSRLLEGVFSLPDLHAYRQNKIYDNLKSLVQEMTQAKNIKPQLKDL